MTDHVKLEDAARAWPSFKVATGEQVLELIERLRTLELERDWARAVAGRLWCDDRPDDSTVNGICVWLADDMLAAFSTQPETQEQT